MNKVIFTLLCFLFLSFNAQANTFDRVYSILQTNCAQCHSNGGSATVSWDMGDSKATAYASIFETTPNNQMAANAGYKMIEPGYSRRSYLFKKINTLDAGFQLHAEEGGLMPFYSNALADAEQEIIRQWIVNGAPLEGDVINEQLIEDFYAGEGLPKLDPIDPPAEGEGFQIYVEPYFLAPGDEVEYFKKHELNLPENTDVTKLDIHMDEFSHHYIIYKFLDNEVAATYEKGRRVLTNILDIADSFVNTAFVSIWQYDLAHELPYGTAYKWDSGDVIDLNYHVKNYSSTQILGAEAYINVYTKPRSDERLEMVSDLIAYNIFDPFALVIEPGENTYEIEQFFIGSNTVRYFWTMQAHTHQLGTDYDIFHRNADGSQGEQVYEGFYNSDYTENIGFYDFEHPPVLKFNEFLPINMGEGLIHRAQYFNPGSTPVSFGLTTNDEMFITYYQYTEELPPTDPTINTTSIVKNSLQLYPNPAQSSININLPIHQIASVKVLNVSGQLLIESSSNQLDINHLPSGIYNVETLDVKGNYYNSKFIKGK